MLSKTTEGVSQLKLPKAQEDDEIKSVQVEDPPLIPIKDVDQTADSQDMVESISMEQAPHLQMNDQI